MRMKYLALMALGVGVAVGFDSAVPANAAVTSFATTDTAMSNMAAAASGSITHTISHRHHRYGRHGGYRHHGYRPYRHHGHRPYRRHRGYRPYHGHGGYGIRLYVRPQIIVPAPPPVYTVPHYRGAARSCSYWQARCSANWYDYRDISGCLRYHGCY